MALFQYVIFYYLLLNPYDRLPSLQSAFRPNTFNAATNRNNNDNNRQTGAILESLRILPDDDNDGLVDVTGQLKALDDGGLLDLTGHVRVAGLLDTCVEVLVSSPTLPSSTSYSVSL